jgi:TusA-related sulfurtransferase
MAHHRQGPGVEATEAPPERPREYLDVRDLPPPEPLTETLELLAETGPETVVVQTNDRAPQHLYPKLSERGYEYDTVEGAHVLTAIWRE